MPNIGGIGEEGQRDAGRRETELVMRRVDPWKSGQSLGAYRLRNTDWYCSHAMSTRQMMPLVTAGYFDGSGFQCAAVKRTRGRGGKWREEKQRKKK
ncbi:hypothetical protein C0Q70_09884 [Pomacea canaliculata]|uniref:Uncharacterized protein n=1 Tax=Pomacea canaliculata TaxID=400727 RepID=A0A2T7PB24_POMCA|nr:hypothetical protein C0Q70_09884 [Pomacea canaliculata]